MKPKLSILLPAMKGYESVRTALAAWEMQTCRDRLEILVLCPGTEAPLEAREAALASKQVIVLVGTADLHEARAIGIQAASGDYIMLAEDHCLPDGDWAQAILNRIDEGWDAVGPALRPGNRSSCWTEASFLLGYSEWMAPIAGGPVKVLCGWNGTIRTQALRQFGPDLADQLLLGAFLIRRLGAQGNRFYLEDRARMRHFDPPGWAFEIFLLTLVGLGFGAKRTQRWSFMGRLFYPLAAPAIAFLHWKRGFRNYRRTGTACGLRPTALVASMALAVAWGAGEVAGAWLGVSFVAPHLWRTEVKPVSADVVARSNEEEGLATADAMVVDG